MEKHFQIAEFPPDTFPEEAEASEDRQTPRGQLAGAADRSPLDARSSRVGGIETVVFQDGVPPARRVSLPNVEAMSFRMRTRSEPANFTCALQYGRELRRMSDEFVSTFTESKGLRISKSAGAIVTRVYRKVTTYLPRSRKASDDC